MSDKNEERVIVQIGDVVKFKNAKLPKIVVATTDEDFIGDYRLTRITNAQRAVDRFGARVIGRIVYEDETEESQ